MPTPMATRAVTLLQLAATTAALGSGGLAPAALLTCKECVGLGQVHTILLYEILSPPHVCQCRCTVQRSLHVPRCSSILAARREQGTAGLGPPATQRRRQAAGGGG